MNAYINTTELYKGYAIQIVQDDDPSSPREDDNLGTMLVFHKRYTLGDDRDTLDREIKAAYKTRLPKKYRDLLDYDYGSLADYFTNTENFSGWKDLAAEMRAALDLAAILPLYVYEHGGITMNTGGFSCPWDSGQVGFIFISKAKARYEYGYKRITKARREKLEEYLRNEVETYDQYLTGDVWGYKIFPLPDDPEEFDPQTDDLEHACKDWDDKDSCWGFFGSEYALEEAHSLVDHYAKG